jgi:hypothetical protein
MSDYGFPTVAAATHLAGPGTAAPRADPLRRSEHVFAIWGHVVPEGTDWRACLSREYWSRNTEKLFSGSTVQIRTADSRVWLEMLVLYSNPATDPPTLDAVFRAVHPSDLQLPAFSKQRPARFEVRTFPGGDGSWCVVDLRTGERPHENGLRRQAAFELATRLELAANNAEADLLAGAAADEVEPAAAPAERPAAALDAHHVHDAGGGQFEVHGPGCVPVAVGFESLEDAESVLAAFAPAPPVAVVADVVRIVEKEPRPRSSRPRGRPRKPAPGRSPEPQPPMAAASTEG